MIARLVSWLSAGVTVQFRNLVPLEELECEMSMLDPSS